MRTFFAHDALAHRATELWIIANSNKQSERQNQMVLRKREMYDHWRAGIQTEKMQT